MRSALAAPRPLQILIASGSEATLALLKTMLQGFYVKAVSSAQEARHYLQTIPGDGPPLDFVILDDQSETHGDELARLLHATSIPTFKETKVINLYTPTTSSSGQAVFSNSKIPGVMKMTKPPRMARLLQTLANLKNLPHLVVPHHTSEVTKAMEDIDNAQRTLFGNVLIAEGNVLPRGVLFILIGLYR